MKLAEALKKFSFILKIKGLTKKIYASVANQLALLLKGDDSKIPTPFAEANDPIELIVDWDIVFEDNVHKMNKPLLDLEKASSRKFGSRSFQAPFSERVSGIKDSFSSQSEGFVPKVKFIPGPGSKMPTSIEEAFTKVKLNSASGFPFMKKKGKCKEALRANFDRVLDRQDPCMLYTRTQEGRKTRNVWGFPFADTVYELCFYTPILAFQRMLKYRSILNGPKELAKNITEIINYAMRTGRIIYAVDFIAFDASVRWQIIVKVYEYYSTIFSNLYYAMIMELCIRFYTIPIVTPTGIFRGKHGIPSGAVMTNETGSMAQIGVASNLPFINLDYVQVQGDDGIYTMFPDEIRAFEDNWKQAHMNMHPDKPVKAMNYTVFCSHLHHDDYRFEGICEGIYPTYRALNRLCFQERFVNFKKLGIRGKDYYGIRAITILENCKFHPLFEELVRFVYSKEKYKLDVSTDGLAAYCEALDASSADYLNHKFGVDVSGIRLFDTYQIVQKILIEEEQEVILSV
jgi:hypothetical protein